MLEPPKPHLAACKGPKTKKTTTRPVPSNKFEFVASDPGGKPHPDARKIIRSHVMRGKNKKRHDDDSQRNEVARTNTSASEAHRGDALVQIEALAAIEAPQPAEHDSSEEVAAQTPCPTGISRVPSDLRLFNFAAPLDEVSRHMIFMFLTTVKETMYPVEWCCQRDHTKVCWFRWLLEDPAYLQSVLFMVSAFQDFVDLRAAANGGHVNCSGGGFSARTQSRLRQSIRLLQGKIQDRETQIEDTTISVVATLAMVADAAGDVVGFKAHARGLSDMVRMRGGLASLDHNRQLQIKLCQVDLGWSITSGSKPNLYDDKLSWEPILELTMRRNSIPYNRPPPSGIQSAVERCDYRLQHVFTDLYGFSNMANSLVPGHEKLRPELFQEIMLSIQYRLLLLEYPVDVYPLEETIRIGLLAFESTLFLHSPKLGLKLKSERFYRQLRQCIEEIHIDSPEIADLKLWLLLVGSVIVFKGNETWLAESIDALVGDQAWSEVRKRVKGVMWIDIIHDDPGKLAFATATQGRVM
ncbi:hypothetical protein BGZ61DRAFT_536689 [Ilyonectria robusta]|uniref:uncharacterized protein n=1 Tax=Ilyonectria robusta TaxID=1079257 RepID=UPI001E8D4B14|nr:uncharacterized protein BGZ61DRAFT_536689 [Ilyonectria robusta]KAH8673123.1 hypothetical protein BGZ61DRAFT_536689 [Ilyonectria robusta]